MLKGVEARKQGLQKAKAAKPAEPKGRVVEFHQPPPQPAPRRPEDQLPLFSAADPLSPVADHLTDVIHYYKAPPSPPSLASIRS